MVAYGDGAPGGGIHGDSFRAVAQYFEQRTCRHCEQPYTAEGIEFLRQEPGVIVVKVGCALCGKPLGIALVGMNNLTGPGCEHLSPQPIREEKPKLPKDWSKKDTDRLTNKPPISYDDVLAAHEFFASLGSDWASQLPKSKAKPVRVRAT